MVLWRGVQRLALLPGNQRSLLWDLNLDLEKGGFVIFFTHLLLPPASGSSQTRQYFAVFCQDCKNTEQKENPKGLSEMNASVTHNLHEGNHESPRGKTASSESGLPLKELKIVRLKLRYPRDGKVLASKSIY